MVLPHSRYFSLQQAENLFFGKIELKNIIKASQIVLNRFHTFDPRPRANTRPHKTYGHDIGTKKKKKDKEK